MSDCESSFFVLLHFFDRDRSERYVIWEGSPTLHPALFSSQSFKNLFLSFVKVHIPCVLSVVAFHGFSLSLAPSHGADYSVVIKVDDIECFEVK